MPVWLAPIAGKAALVVGALLGGLLIYWLIRKHAKKEERLEAALEVKERERKAQEDVARLRGGPGPGPWGDSVRKLEKPWEQPTDPKRPGAPKD